MFAGTKKELETAIRAATRKPRHVRAAIAHELGISEATLYRKSVALKRKGRRGLDRKGRSDKGDPRALPFLWVNIARVSFFSTAAASFAGLHREISRLCRHKGIEPPSYSWCRRWVNEVFRHILSGGRIRRIGNFERRGGAVSPFKH